MKKISYSLRKSKKIGLAPIVLSQFLILSPYVSETPQLLNLNRVYADEVVDGVTRATPNTELNLSADSVKVVDRNGKKYLEISLPDNQIYDKNYINLNMSGYYGTYLRVNDNKEAVKLDNGKQIGTLVQTDLIDRTEYTNKPEVQELKRKVEEAKANNQEINASKELILEALKQELLYQTEKNTNLKLTFNNNINEGLLDRKIWIEVQEADYDKVFNNLVKNYLGSGQAGFPNLDLTFKYTEDKTEKEGMISYLKDNLKDAITPKISYKDNVVYTGTTKDRLFFIDDSVLRTETRERNQYQKEESIVIHNNMQTVKEEGKSKSLKTIEFLSAFDDNAPIFTDSLSGENYFNRRIEVKPGDIEYKIKLDDDGAYKFKEGLPLTGEFGDLNLAKRTSVKTDGFLNVKNENIIGTENDSGETKYERRTQKLIYNYDPTTKTMTVKNKDSFVIEEWEKFIATTPTKQIFEFKNNWVDFVDLEKESSYGFNQAFAPLKTGVKASMTATNSNLNINEKEVVLNTTASIKKDHPAYATYRNGEYTVTGKYVDENGTPIQDDKLLATGAWNDKFNVKHDDIQGYEYVSSNVPTTGVYNAVNRTITFTYRGIDKTEELPFKTIYEEDPNLEEGKQIVTQEGKNGNRVTDNKGKVKSETPPQNKIVKIGVKPKITTEEIPFEIKYIEDPNLEEGEEEVRQEGKNGRKTTTINYVVNKETGKVTEQKPKITTDNPVDKIIARGTKKKEVPKEEIPKTPEIKKLTKYIDDKGNLLKEKDGLHDKEEISGYKYMTTNTSEDGNLVEHIYHKIQIMYVDEEGNPITEEEGNDPSKYTFVREEVDPKTGDITRIYHKVVTKFVDENGNVIQQKDGTHDKEDLDGFEFVRTEILENGDVIHYYKKKEAPKPAENKPVEPKKDIPAPKTEPKELPKTGEVNSATISLIGIGLLGAMGASTLRKRKED